MKKVKRHPVENMRAEHKRPDFPQGLVRGKDAKRVAEGPNVVILDPEIAAAFPTSKAVNEALGLVLRAARSARLRRIAAAQAKPRR